MGQTTNLNWLAGFLNHQQYDWWSVVDTIWGLIPIFAAYFKDISPKLLVYCTLAANPWVSASKVWVRGGGEGESSQKVLKLRIPYCSRGVGPLDSHDIRFTLPETNSSHLKMDGWKTIVSFWGSGFLTSAMLVSGGVRITTDLGRRFLQTWWLVLLVIPLMITPSNWCPKR